MFHSSKFEWLNRNDHVLHKILLIFLCVVTLVYSACKLPSLTHAIEDFAYEHVVVKYNQLSPTDILHIRDTFKDIMGNFHNVQSVTLMQFIPSNGDGAYRGSAAMVALSRDGIDYINKFNMKWVPLRESIFPKQLIMSSIPYYMSASELTRFCSHNPTYSTCSSGISSVAGIYFYPIVQNTGIVQKYLMVVLNSENSVTDAKLENHLDEYVDSIN